MDSSKEEVQQILPFVQCVKRLSHSDCVSLACKVTFDSYLNEKPKHFTFKILQCTKIRRNDNCLYATRMRDE